MSTDGEVIQFPGQPLPLDRDGEEIQLVDSHLLPDDEPQGPERRPIIPSHLRRENLRDTIDARLELYWYRLRYHVARIPVYLIASTFWSVVGITKLTATQMRWWWMTEATPLRMAAVDSNDPLEYRDQVKLARKVRGFRGYALLAELLAVVSLIVWLGWFAPRWAAAVSLVAAVPLLAHFGRPADRPIITRAVTPLQSQPLDSAQVTHALSRLGLSGINQAIKENGHHAIGYPDPVREDGPGWRADVDLPPGVTAAEVIDKRDKLASALNRPLGCVWPEGDPEVSPGRLVLWVGRKDMVKAPQPAWPLLKSGTADLFKPFPFGTNQRGRKVSATLMFVSCVIGGMPRMGKTFALRLALLAASLDPRAEIHAYDLKGTGDLSPLEPVAHRYRAGDDEDDIRYALADLNELQAELRRRTKEIRDLPRDLCPENKVTPELANMRSKRLHPIVIGVDECQLWFEHPNRGAQFKELVTDLVKRGPAVGIIMMLATQRPDANSLPTAISHNALLRFCLKVLNHDANDMVLGGGMHKAGIKATMFSRRDIGIGYMAGEEADPKIVRTYYIDAAMADRVVKRARALREHAGTLSGHAVGAADDMPQAPEHDLLADVKSVWPRGQEKVWSQTLVDRLAEMRPGAYGPWAALEPTQKATQLANALKPFRVETGQVWGQADDGGSPNRNGVYWGDLERALHERRRSREMATT
jgi:S-DNA-T family DNA segregation ATPase FtsK/SpoIIIE